MKYYTFNYTNKEGENKEFLITGEEERFQKLEEEYAERFPIRRVFAGAGPYNLARTYDFYVSQPKTSIPCSLPMLIIGMAYGENLPLRRGDYFQPVLMEKCQDLIESKKWTLFEVNERLDPHIDVLLKPLIFDKTDPHRSHSFQSSLTGRLFF